MSLDAVSAVTSASTYTPDVTAAKTADKQPAAETKPAEESGVVYEKSQETEDASAKKTYKRNDALIEKLKADQAARQQQLIDIVNKMMGKQVNAFGQANSDNSDMWKFLASGDYEVDPETKAQAQKDIAEDGYWGVKQTSERILDFANALTGGDPSKIQEMRDSFLKGYKQAEKTWGGELPDISKQTYDAVLKGFDKMAEEAGITLESIS